MTRIKHIVKQVTLDNNSFNIRFKFVKTTRAKTTRKEQLIKNIKSLLKISIANFVIINLKIHTLLKF